MGEGGDKPKKAHKKKNAGMKKKKGKKKEIGKVEKHNPRANTFSGGVKSVQKRVQYTLEKQAKKLRAPKIDKNPDVPPPFVVVVQGPPGCGKSTLIQSLVKHYAKQRLIEMRGPVTLVSGRQRRITIVECPQEMSAMLDLAKVADLVLLLVDASYGFELETFEFINILQVQGFPRVIGVLTHLDSFKDNKQVRKVKKTMKHRFWTELYDGCKLFYLSGLQYGRYHRLEIQNLARFIAVQKVPLLSWRQSHPYLLALRWEDHTDPTKPASAGRRLDIYGYVYGGRMREGGEVHLAGVGDFPIASLKQLPDPVPPPMETEAERRRAANKKEGDKPLKKNALRTLAERHRVVYAPGSDIGSITVDSEAMYIYVPEQKVGFTEENDDEEESFPSRPKNDEELPEAVRMVRALQKSDSALDKNAESRPSLRLLKNANVRLAEEKEPERVRRPAPEAGQLDDEDDGQDGDDEDNGDEDGEEEDDEDAEDEDDEEAHRRDVLEQARRRFTQAPRLENLIYGNKAPQSNGSAEQSNKKSKKSSTDGKSAKPTDHRALSLFDDDEDDSNNGADSHPDGEDGLGDSGSTLLGNMGDIDGLDSSRMLKLPGESVGRWEQEKKEELKSRKFITGGWSSAEEDEDADGDEEKGTGKGSKQKVGAEGDDGENEDEDGDVTGDEVAPTANASEQVKKSPGSFMEGFSDSMPIAAFVRLRLEDVPAACVEQMKKDRPMIIGGLLPGESRMGLVQVRTKRHRWHPKLLKSNDALLLSVGWRRFQTVPMYSLEDRGESRMRYLKYTLEHAHCIMTCYAPMVPPNTGVLAFRSWNKVSHFRVAATGVALESGTNFEVKKKLKLTGEPYKIFRNTAFIKGMFNSDLEVNKYSHAKIQTVSGIRGEIKKAEGTKGQFRASFEDRILMSDIVVCKCWINVAPKQFYHPVVDVKEWRAAKLIGELRAEKGVPVPDNRDSQYGKQLVRAERKFNALKVPKQLQEALPFSAKHKFKGKKKVSELKKKTAIVSSERDKSINSLLQRLYTVRKEKQKVRQESNARRKKAKDVQDKFIQDKRDANQKETKKKRYIKEGEELKKKRKAMMMD
eukprot:TRINITY_DN3326_c1_g1_i1.p1 TRINITY_DN3326_c1_g1~~TRINITY_DN3326_c1_g1_i1.p1  ORF type:complete len:1083 (-),score=266.11 TRINITY_DN3326_c1_g1_i1:100-3348(-)